MWPNREYNECEGHLEDFLLWGIFKNYSLIQKQENYDDHQIWILEIIQYKLLHILRIHFSLQWNK